MDKNSHCDDFDIDLFREIFLPKIHDTKIMDRVTDPYRASKAWSADLGLLTLEFPAVYSGQEHAGSNVGIESKV